MNTTTIIADLAFSLPRLLTLLQMLSIPPSGTHRDKITVITSVRPMVIPMWLHSKESHTLSLGAMGCRILWTAYEVPKSMYFYFFFLDNTSSNLSTSIFVYYKFTGIVYLHPNNFFKFFTKNCIAHFWSHLVLHNFPRISVL